MPDDSKIQAFADALWTADGEYRDEQENVRKFVRQRYETKYAMAGRTHEAAPPSRPLGVVQMFASFPEASPRVTVPSIVPDSEEDKKATAIERFLKGIRRATKHGPLHPDDAVWLHYAENGRGILYVQFDLDLAKQGLFPFRRLAIDPLTFAFKMSDRGMVCAVQVEDRDPLELYDELAGVYEKVKDNKPAWKIPDRLQQAYDDYDTRKVKVMRFWDREHEYMWVDNEPVWKYYTGSKRGDVKEGRPHLMGVCPFQIGFCVQMPGEKASEWGGGLIKYVMGQMKASAKMLDKAYLGFEFFFLPHVILEEPTGVRIEQVVPGGVYDGVNKYTVVNPTPNSQMMQQLLSLNDQEISLASLSNTTMSGDIPQVAGYLFAQANSGPQRKNERMLDSLTDAYKEHYNLILNRVGEFANEEAAREFGLEGDAIKTYLDSFTTFSPMKAAPNSKVKPLVTLDSNTVKGYQVVDLDFKPDAPQDENAKWQRAQMARQLGESMEFVEREVLKVESPEQAREWRQQEQLMQDPEWSQRMMLIWKEDALNADKKLAETFHQQEIAQLPPDIAAQVANMLSYRVPWEEAMAWAQQAMAATGQQPQGPAGQQPQGGAQGGQPPDQQAQMMQGGAQGPMMQPQGQPAAPGQLDPQTQALMQQLPPQIQQLVMQLMQQGMTFDQAVQYLQQQAQQQGQGGAPQNPSGGFVSPASMGQQPVPPDQQQAMQGFGG